MLADRIALSNGLAILSHMSAQPPPTLDYQPPQGNAVDWARFFSGRICLAGGKMALAYLVFSTLVIPRFATIFADFGLKLPWATQFVIDISTFQKRYGLTYAIVPLALLVAVGLSMLTWRGNRIDSRPPRRWTARVLWILLILLLAYLILAMALPMSALINGVNGSK